MSQGRGRGGRGGFGAANIPPMGLTFVDIQNLSREAGELYPPMDPLPEMTASTAEERQICALQNGFITRLRASKYYLVEVTKTNELPRYSDKYRPSPAAQPTLKRKELHQPFFPQEIFEDYFNPRRRKKERKRSGKKVKLDDVAKEGEEDQDASSEKASDGGGGGGGDSEAADEGSDYDVDDEYDDNDYVQDYFDNGEGDDLDDLGDGGGGGGGGGEADGGGDYD